MLIIRLSFRFRPDSIYRDEYRNPLTERGDSGTSPTKKQRDTAGMTHGLNSYNNIMKLSKMKILNLFNISHGIPYFLFIITLLTTCSKDSPIEPIELQEVNTRTFGNVTFTGEKTIKIRNDFGGIILYGINQVDTIGYMLYKIVKAERPKIARDHLDNIILESNDEPRHKAPLAQINWIIIADFH